ncbi:MAG: hypothetical protein ACE15B_24925 [Bryobacteraceae bacterium]
MKLPTETSAARGVRTVALGMLLLGIGLAPLSAQVQVIPQVADGAGWSTTIVLVNKTANTALVSLAFRQSAAGGATSAWTPPFLESVNLSGISLAAGSALFLHTPGTAASLTQGWGQLTAPDGVAGYAIFTARNAGGPPQDATAPAVTAAGRILVPFDNTEGLVSAVALVNPTAAAETVSVNLRTSDGSTSTATLPSLPANGQVTFLMPNQFSQTTGKRGLAEFYVSSGSISAIALRARTGAGDVAMTSAPVYPQSGAPIIGGGGSGPGGSVPQSQVIPQVADGGGWSTTIVLTNATAADQQVRLTFRMAVPGGNGETIAWNPPLLESVSLTGLNIPAGSTVFLHTPGEAAALSQGWAELAANQAVQGYAIFTVRTPGQPAQDSTAPAVSASNRILVPFDNSSGLVTAVAAVNPTGAGESVTVNIRTTDGATGSTTVELPAQGQIAFLMRDRLNATAGKSGLAEFYVASGSLSFIGLRANGAAITSAPVYFETGSPVITISGGGGGGTPGGGSAAPTQEEINAWIARGNYSAGILSLSRATAYSTTDQPGAGGITPVTTTKKTDGFSGVFARYAGTDLAKVLRGEFPAGYPNLSPSPGNCVVYQTTAILSNPFPNLTMTSLDAGPQLTSSGPNGTQAAPRQGSQANVFTYESTAMPNTYLAPGRYTLSGPGGANVGAFSGTLDIAQDFVVTNNADDFKLINRANPVTVRWTGGDSSSIVTISGMSGGVNMQTGAISGSAFVCIQNVSAGQFTVPASILTQLPASSVLGAGGFNFVTRGSFSVRSQGKGARFTAPSGLDILTAFNDWTWSYTPQYQ